MKTGFFSKTQRVIEIASNRYKDLTQIIVRKVDHSLVINYVFFLATIIIIGISLFILAKLRMQTIKLGYEFRKLEKKKMKLIEEVNVLSNKFTELTSRKNLLKLNKEMKINLQSPSQWTRSKNYDK